MSGPPEGYRLVAQRVIPAEPAEVLGWLCRPELMTQWIQGLTSVDLLAGDPCSPGARTAIELSTKSRYASLDQRLQGRIDEVGPTWLVRTYWWLQSHVTWYRSTADKYARTIVYEMTPTPDGTRVRCEIAIIGVGQPQMVRYLSRREQKSLELSLELLSRRCQGKGRPWRRWFTKDPVAQAL